ncbi:MAG: FHA domain-containing protein [Planctomycetaceae bacterium]|nr:FHA domain-containing protein [Planctomycetaceae bacterium]
MPLSAKLVVVGGEVKSAEIKLRLPSTIGRGRGATIMLPHPLVSRQHCELFETNGRLMVRDLGSLNGTFVNNERITEAQLPPGELLTVGAVTFRAVYDLADSSAPPEGAGPRLKSGHARDTDPNGTARPSPKSTAPKSAAETVPAGPQSSQPTVPVDDDFNFEIPVMPVDEGAPQRDTDRAPLPPEDKAAENRAAEQRVFQHKSVEKKTDVPAQKTAEPAAPARPAPASGAPPASSSTPPESAKGEPPAKDVKVDFAKWEQEDDQPPAPGHEDDDFGDFLKSLGTK